MTSEHPSVSSALSQPTLSLDLDEIITQLSKPRGESFHSWYQSRSHFPLPSREALFRIVDRLRAVLFPYPALFTNWQKPDCEDISKNRLFFSQIAR
jgi:serine O-acetyltransferase